MTDTAFRSAPDVVAGRPTIMFWVQHLLGVGHLARVSALADACAAAGMDAQIASGGPPSMHAMPKIATLHQLPVLRAADEGFSGLVDEARTAVDEPLWQARRSLLRDLVRRVQPTIVVLEHYPFGRRAFRAEIADLLNAAASIRPCRIVVSVRDILVERQAKRWAEAAAFIDDHVDLVCVHGDPKLIELNASFPHANRIAPKTRYTGYVDLGTDANAEAAPARQHGRGDILVSAGGGPVGSRLRQVAAAMGRGPGDEPVRIRVGAGVAADEVERLTVQAAGKSAGTVTIEPNKPDFRARLRRCACSVSQAGYNTVVDLLSTKAPSVLVPFDAAGETEQTVRAGRMADLGRAVIVKEQDLTVDSLRTAIRTATKQRQAGDSGESIGIDLNGASRFAAAMQTLAKDAIKGPAS